MSNRSAVFGLFFSTLALSGLACGSSGPKLYPVRGSVLFEGQPAEGATVILEPMDADAKGSKPTGTVAADGSFSVQTHPHGNGVPPGEYTVLITWYPADARQAENAQNKLPPKYGDPALTPLQKVTIKAGANDLPPFRLTK